MATTPAAAPTPTASAQPDPLEVLASWARRLRQQPAGSVVGTESVAATLEYQLERLAAGGAR